MAFDELRGEGQKLHPRLELCGRVSSRDLEGNQEAGEISRSCETAKLVTWTPPSTIWTARSVVFLARTAHTMAGNEGRNRPNWYLDPPRKNLVREGHGKLQPEGTGERDPPWHSGPISAREAMARKRPGQV
jgi:hypothetical protein